MLKIIRNEKEFKVIDEESEWALDLDCDFENKIGKNYHLEKGKTNLLKFKDNNGFTRFVSESKCVDGYKLDYKLSKNSTTKSSSKVEKWNWLDFATDEEKQTIEDIKNTCIKRHDDEVNNPKYRMKLQRQKLIEQLEKLNKELGLTE